MSQVDPPSSPERPRPLAIDLDWPRWIRRIFLLCLAAEVAVVLLDYHVNYARRIDIPAIRRLFNITREDGLASWLAVTQAALIALTVWLIVALVRRRGASGGRLAGWVVVALFFSWLAVDDGAKVHERIGTAYDYLQKRDATPVPDPASSAAAPELNDVTAAAAATAGGGFPSYYWQMLFLPAFGLLGLFTLVFVWRELADVSQGMLVVAALSCFVFAVGLDFIEGLDPEHPWNLYGRIAAQHPWVDAFSERRFGKEGFDALVHFSKSLEEFIEMLGMNLLWVTFLGHVGRLAGDVHLRLLSDQPPAASTRDPGTTSIRPSS